MHQLHTSRYRSSCQKLPHGPAGSRRLQTRARAELEYVAEVCAMEECEGERRAEALDLAVIESRMNVLRTLQSE
jgi:hypothetical protein